MEIARLCLVKMLLLDEASFQEYSGIPIPSRRYKDKDSKNVAAQAREVAAKQFFEGKSYQNPQALIAYTDFLGGSGAEINEKPAAEAIIET